MRQIKFRAWDKRVKAWFPLTYPINSASAGIWINNIGELFEIRPGVGLPCALREEVYQIQLYTGLKDKNGKEIYEGDILKYLSLKFPIRADCYHGLRSLFGEDQLTKAFALEGEVIGNIYENPELLEKVKLEP